MEDNAQSQDIAEETQFDMPNAFTSDEAEEIEESEDDISSEDEQPQKQKGDLSIALKKERELRRQREAELAQERSSRGKNQTPTFDPSQIPALVQHQLQQERAKDRAMAILPELKSDKELQVMVTSLMYDAQGNLVRNAEQATKIVAKRMGKLVEEKAEEIVKERSAVQSAREQATTAGSIATPSTADTSIDDLRSKIRSSANPKERAKLQAEIIKLKLR